MQVRKYIIFKTRDELLRVKPSQVVFFEGEGNYTKIILSTEQSFTFSTNIGHIEKILRDQYAGFDTMFYRIGKRHIVNVSYITYLNQLKQKLILTSFLTSKYFELECSKEALKVLRDKLFEKISVRTS